MPHLEKLKRTLEIQKELGAPYLRMFSFYIPQGRAPEDFGRRCWTGGPHGGGKGRPLGQRAAHENEKGIYGDNAPRCKELLEAFTGPHFKAVFDFANFVQVGQQTLPA